MKKSILFRVLFYAAGLLIAGARAYAQYKNGTGSFTDYLGGIQYFRNL